MLTKQQMKIKEKDFKERARSDARYFVFKNRNNKTITEYAASLLASYSPERLIKQFNYDTKQADYIINYFNTEFWRGYEYWQNKKQMLDNQLAKYKPILNEAEEYAKTIDVSDIKDGFPCGDVILYAEPRSKLAKLLKNYADSNTSTPAFKYKLPLKLPFYGQCISFDERICKKVKEFLCSKGINCLTYSWID